MVMSSPPDLGLSAAPKAVAGGARLHWDVPSGVTFICTARAGNRNPARHARAAGHCPPAATNEATHEVGCAPDTGCPVRGNAHPALGLPQCDLGVTHASRERIPGPSTQAHTAPAGALSKAGADFIPRAVRRIQIGEHPCNMPATSAHS